MRGAAAIDHGLVLFAHGARDRQWSAPLRDLARRIAAMEPSVIIQTAFLEIEPPSLTEAAVELAGTCARIDILPVFWAPAGHVNSELPRLLKNLRADHPQTVFNVLPTLSEIPGLLDFVARQAIALSARPAATVKASQTSPQP